MKTTLPPTLTHLSAEEQEAPFSVLAQLFSISCIEYWKIELWQYLKASTTKLGWPMMRQPGDAVFLQFHFEKLMESCWQLLSEKEKKDGEQMLSDYVLFSKEWLQDEMNRRQENRAILKEYGGSIRLLRKREIESPYQVIKIFFGTLSLDDWKNMLNDWTEYVLRRVSMFEEIENFDLLVQYEQLERLLEIAWIMHCNHTGKTSTTTKQEKASTAIHDLTQPSPELQAKVLTFLQEVPPERLSHHLLQIYMGYLKCQEKQQTDKEEDAIVQDVVKLYNLFWAAELDAKGLYQEIKRLEREQAKAARV